MEIDYKKIFDSVFEKAHAYELSCFLRNEDVPFEYCRKALKKDGIGWDEKILIALRNDCPDDMLVKICKKQGERFTSQLLYSKKHIICEALEELYKNPINLHVLIKYRKIPDKLKIKILNDLVTLDKLGNVIQYSYYVYDFIEYQYSIPDECWKLIDGVIGLSNKGVCSKEYAINETESIQMNVKLMKSPLNENEVINLFEQPGKNYLWMLKLAANPSISDYIVMQLQIKAPEHLQDEVNSLLVENEKKREEWRSKFN